MKVFQLVMKDETNEKRKDDMRKRVRHTHLMKLLTTPLLGSHVRIQIFSNFLSAILLPFSLGSRSS